MAKFNGHKNWNHWNVSLWLNNDEWLYGLARQFAKRGPTRAVSAKRMLETLHDFNQTKTPDGAPYSVTTIKAAMRGMGD